MEKLFIKIKNKIRSVISFDTINPHNHWKVLLYVFFTIIIILIILSLFFLYKIKNQQIFQVRSKATEMSNLIDDKLLKKVTESFNNKLIKSKEIKNGDYSYKDPSVK